MGIIKAKVGSILTAIRAMAQNTNDMDDSVMYALISVGGVMATSGDFFQKEVEIDPDDIHSWGELVETLGCENHPAIRMNAASITDKGTSDILSALEEYAKQSKYGLGYIQKETDVQADFQLITGKPADIYMTIVDSLRGAVEKANTIRKNEIVFEEEFPGLLSSAEAYNTAVMEKFSNFRTEEEIAVDLNMVAKEGGLKVLMTRLGFPKGLDKVQSNGSNAAAHEISSADIEETVLTALKNNNTFLPAQPKTFREAQGLIKQGKCVDLSGVAGIGVMAGQEGTAVLVKEALEQNERQQDMEGMLDLLKSTEGTVFRHSTADYDRVRDALENVIRLHKDMDAFIKAEPNSPKYTALAKKAPTSREMKEAYAKLDICAQKYLDGKAGRLNGRLMNNDFDVRGTKRYNIISALRSVTCPAALKKMKTRMGELDKKINTARTAEKKVQQPAAKKSAEEIALG